MTTALPIPTLGRSLCHACDATPGGCESLHVLGGRACCASCDHGSDLRGEEASTPARKVAFTHGTVRSDKRVFRGEPSATPGVNSTSPSEQDGGSPEARTRPPAPDGGRGRVFPRGRPGTPAVLSARSPRRSAKETDR